MLHSGSLDAEQTAVSRNAVTAWIRWGRRGAPSAEPSLIPDASPGDLFGRAVTVVPGGLVPGAGLPGPDAGLLPDARPVESLGDPMDEAVEEAGDEAMDDAGDDASAAEPEIDFSPAVPEIPVPVALTPSAPGRRHPSRTAARTRLTALPVPPQPGPQQDPPQPVPEPSPQPVPEPGPPIPAPRPAARRRGATKRQQTQLAGLAERLEAMGGRQEVAVLAMQEAVALIGADTTALVVRSLQGPRVLAQHPSGPGPELWGNRTLAALLAMPEPVRLALAGDPLASGDRTALVTAPVPAGGGSVGVIVARRRSGKAFTAGDEDALGRLARVCGARLHRTPERTAVVRSALDRATGLGRHDLLMADLTEVLRSRPEHGMPATLVVSEIVGLSRLRTAHGTAAADAAVAGIAARMGAKLRMGDLLYRTSDDEIAVLLPATDAERGTAVAQRLDGTVTDDAAGLSLRSVTVPVEETPEGVMLRVIRGLAAARVSERWGQGSAGAEAR
jgi:GGDEF domain-containing protein